MKIIITENQYKLITESEEKQQLLNLINTGDKDNIELAYQIANGMGIWDEILNVYKKFLKLLNFPSDVEGIIGIFNDDLDLKYNIIKKLPSYLTSVGGNLDLEDAEIESLGNLKNVVGSLNLRNTGISSLGNLQYVGGYLSLFNTQIESLGNLKEVGRNLNLRNTPISKMMTEEEIRNKINVNGKIFL